MAKKDARAAFDEARQALQAARLDDPDDHFPYKLDEGLALDLDAPAGPNGPDDDSLTVRDFITHDLVRATAKYVEAQATYLADPGDGTKGAYEAARDELVAARQDHRLEQRRPGWREVQTVRLEKKG
jgi:hypothetical protein